MSTTDWISNRELSVSLVVVGLAVIGFSIPRTRRPMMALARAVMHPQLLMLTVAATIYVVCVLQIFEPKAGWTLRHGAISLFWVFTIGLPLCASLVKRFEEANWYSVLEETSRRISATAVLGMIASYRSFSLLAEVMILLFMVVLTFGALAMLRGVTSKKRDRLMIAPSRFELIFGGIFLIYSLVSILQAPELFFRPETAVDFVLPFFLTATFLPFSCVLLLYVIYSEAWFRSRLYIRRNSLRCYAIGKALLSFGTNIKAIKPWLHRLALVRPRCKSDVDASIARAR